MRSDTDLILTLLKECRYQSRWVALPTIRIVRSFRSIVDFASTEKNGAAKVIPLGLSKLSISSHMVSHCSCSDLRLIGNVPQHLSICEDNSPVASGPVFWSGAPAGHSHEEGSV